MYDNIFIKKCFSDYQQNTSTAYAGQQGEFGGPGNSYNQGEFGGGGNSYSQGGCFYEQDRGYNSGGHPNFSQQPYVAYPYVQNLNIGRTGYPPAQSGDLGPETSHFMLNDQRTQRLNQVILRYEINQQFAAHLQALGNCEVVLLCDDSGSMNTPLLGTNQTR